jgi:hypothetical protein
MSNILHFLWLATTTRGRKVTKSEIIYLQNNQNFNVLNIYNSYFIIREFELIVLILFNIGRIEMEGSII